MHEANICNRCGMSLGDNPALHFLHQEMHREAAFPYSSRAAFSLTALPFVLFPRIAQLMQDYADASKHALTTEKEPQE